MSFFAVLIVFKKSLNPCFCGSRSMRITKAVEFTCEYRSLNPCFCGSRSMRGLKLIQDEISERVLILVFVEVGL